MPTCYGMWIGAAFAKSGPPPRKSNVGRGFHPKKVRSTK